jgi:hypothetical protein
VGNPYNIPEQARTKNPLKMSQINDWAHQENKSNRKEQLTKAIQELPKDSPIDFGSSAVK